MLKYCVKCVLPHTKPHLSINEEGVCIACQNYTERRLIDWESRRKKFDQIVDRYRQNGAHWDCIVPVSGGKDSTYQVHKVLELGLNPLCVTATTCHLSIVGQKNLKNIQSFGVDHMELSPNPIIRKKMNVVGLKQVGDISWAEHVAILTIPVRAAVQYGVPLIIWGENSQNEYGGPLQDCSKEILDRRWLEEFGGMLGLRVSDFVGLECGEVEIEAKHLIPYTYPSSEDLERVGVRGLFLGQFFPWDGFANAEFAKANGFSGFSSMVEGSVADYENLDNYQTGIHDYFKFLKFGFGRAADIASMAIRRGRTNRQDGLELVNQRDGKFPWSYLGKPLGEILGPLEIDVDEFVRICDRFTNKKLFVTDAQGRLVKDKSGNLKKINYDNE